MSELLQNWLNNEVGLSTNVANFERDFANGYLFGEILHKFRQQDDFELFSNKNTYEAKIANFKRLGPTLKALGIKFNASQSNAMMNSERGASLRLLYQMKMATERLLLACDSGGPAQAPAGGGVTKGIRIPRDTYDDHERHFFEHRLRATCPNVKQQRLDKVTKKYEEERHKQEIVSMEMDNVDQARVAEQRDIHRFSLRERMRQNKVAKDEWTRQSVDLWEQTMQVRAMREQRAIDYENNVAYKQQDKTNRTRDLATKEVTNGIDVFERGLQNLGLSAPRVRQARVNDGDSTDSDRSENQADRLEATTTPAANARELVESLQARMPSPQELQREAGLFLRKIKESKHAGSIARKERERRRRRVLVEQQREQDLLEESKLEEVLLETLSRESDMEKKISYTQWRTTKYEDVIAQNRQLRVKEYTARRKSDQQEALRRDQDLFNEMLDVMRDMEERERVRYRAIERGRRAEHLASLSEECEGILELVRTMAMAELQQEQFTDKEEVDSTLWREWTSLFVENVPVSYEVLAFRFEPTSFQQCEKEAFSNEFRRVLQNVGVPEAEVAKLQVRIRDNAATVEVGGRGPIIDSVKELMTEKPVTVMGMLPEVAEVPASVALDKSVATMYPLTALPPTLDADDVHGSILNECELRDYMNGLGQWQVMDIATLAPDADVSPEPGASSSAASPSPGAAAFNVEQEANLMLEDAKEVSFAARLNPAIDSVESRPVNYRLGTIVAALLDRTYAQPPPPDPPPMPDVPLRLVMTGKPFAGKRTLAARLAETYGLQVIDVDEVVRECFLLSKRPDLGSTGPIDVLSFTAETAEEDCKRAEEAGNPYIRQLQEVGYELQQRLDRGEAVDNETYVHMITTKIRSLFPDRIPKKDVASDAAADTSSAPTAPPLDNEPGRRPDDPEGGEDADAMEVSPDAAGDAGAQSMLEPSGWILIGFPQDKAQLCLLERFMSGWVAKEATPTPEVEAHKAEAALIAPVPPQEPPPFEAVPGGYDLHIRLEVPADEAVRRAVGRRVDPANSLQYHLEDSPPCNKNQIIYERLVPVDDLTNSMGTLMTRIHSFDVAQTEVEPLLSYFGPFPEVERLVCIDANRPAEAVYDSLEEQVAMLLERKRAQKAKEIADQEEAKALAEAEALAEKQALEEAEREFEKELRSGAPSPEPDEAASGKSKGSKDSKEKAKAKAKAAPEPAAPEPVEAPPVEIPIPEPTTLAELPKVVEKLEDRLYNLLLTEWRQLQSNYVENCRHLFSWYRAHRVDFNKGLHGIQQRFVQYLQRPDDKQVLVDQFVQRFNRFSEEYPNMRKQGDTKDELHLQVDELHETLKSRINTRRDDSTAQLQAIEQARWVEAQVEVFAAQVQHAVQLEARRYYSACQLLSDFYWGGIGTGLPPIKNQPPKINALSDQAEEPPADDPKGKKPAKGKKEEEPPPDDPAKFRAEKLRKRVEDRWEFPFLTKLTEQANAVIWKLTEFGAPVAEEEKEEKEVKGKAKAKPKAKGAASPEPAEKPAEPAPALYVDLQQALVAERLVYGHRLTTLMNWAERRLQAITVAGEETFSRLNDWVLLRQRKDLDAVLELSHILKDHIENEELITSRLTLEGAHLHHHPNVLLKAPAPPIIPPSLENIVPHRWSIDQLNNLLATVLCAAHNVNVGGRLLPTHALLSQLIRMTQPEAREEPMVPACWRPCDVERLNSLCSLFDHPPRVGTVDCVEFLMHIGLLHSPLGWPSLDTLINVRRHLMAMMPAGSSWPDFWITTAQFESLPFFEDYEGAEQSLAQKHAPETASEPGAFNRSAAQQKWLGQVLRSFPAPLRQTQAYELEMSWYRFYLRNYEEQQRNAHWFDDENIPPSASPHQVPTDAMAALVATSIEPESPLEDCSEKKINLYSSPPPPPRPIEPQGLPTPTDPNDAISVRQLLTYLCQGSYDRPEDGLTRAIAILAPHRDIPDRLQEIVASPQDFHAALLQLGARPTPPDAEGDGRPRHPSVARLFEELFESAEAHASSPGGNSSSVQPMSVADFLENPKGQALMNRLYFNRRHCRQPVDKLFPQNLKPGARLEDSRKGHS